MSPEEYLDRLIERREHGEKQLPVINDTVAVGLAAAETLVQLQEIDVPPEFAGRLELYIRTRARSFGHQNGDTTPLPRLRNPAGSRRFPVHRAWIAVLGIAAMLMLAFVGILTASAQSLPGDVLYGLKQAEYQFTLNFASNPQNRTNVQIDQLHSTLIDLSTVANDGRDDEAIKQALDIVASKTFDIQKAIAALPAGSEREATQRGLDVLLAEEEQTLRHLLDHVDWPIRLAFTQQLGALGDPVPTVTHVIVRTQSNGTLLITLTGTHFAPQVEFFIDGHPAGVISQSTSEQLVAVISKSVWSTGEHAFGVRNPDGTAAQLDIDGDDHEPNQQGTDYSNSRNGTPVPEHDDNGR